MSRRELREHIFRILFTADFYEPDQDAVREQVDLYFTHIPGDDLDFPPTEVGEEEREEITQRVLEIASKIPEIDALIDQTSTGWKTGRMSRTDLSILRLAVYEMDYDDTIPVGVSINEAVLLAKKFGGDDSSSFVNGVLGKLGRKQQEKKEEAGEEA